jgi:hypothetical protein
LSPSKPLIHPGAAKVKKHEYLTLSNRYQANFQNLQTSVDRVRQLIEIGKEQTLTQYFK